MTNHDAKNLIRKYRSGGCSEKEKQLLHAWYRDLAYRDAGVPPETEIEQALDEVSSSLPLDRNRRFHRWQIAAAIFVLFVFSAGIYVLREQGPDSRFSGNIYKNDVAPGGNKAILELADGSVIDLNQANVGQISSLATKTRDDQVKWRPGQQTRNKTLASRYNTIRTPRGGQYQVVLPDGSGAWLNSASSIRFPAVFNGNERKVEITGEVYFEVARKYNKSDTGNVVVPFIVVVNDQRIEAIGTAFNVNAYPDEGLVRTTLVEGSIRLWLPAGAGFRLLKAGEQAQATSAELIAVNEADPGKVVAWKNGQFQYEMDGIATIMRQVERWYDVEVIYEGEIPKKKFVGTISRNIPLSKFLDILSYTGVNFRIEGRKIVVIS